MCIIVIKGHEYPRRGLCTSVHSLGFCFIETYIYVLSPTVSSLRLRLLTVGVNEMSAGLT